ncbi:hypothetical protein BCR41DRAFT_350271 [Lobosporangium transversale]|uniref:Uncharacterized protein n=1 Tax=Lobosporangium transversale TaxID=64571 RepID=A0A1Y2GT27_9FUNG|nr:hypothetical protein BCR41DRAFT_350271 [Lobosporangium transversale]ORZ21940.1 hypothetical protein BCR41DRAFT_350271 [Lobosporangium transversale]|eukprot:XP_021883191.1 hypothetical protein BCR41DRAFT_350271 [Lobosporangium transversale]
MHLATTIIQTMAVDINFFNISNTCIVINSKTITTATTATKNSQIKFMHTCLPLTRSISRQSTLLLEQRQAVIMVMAMVVTNILVNHIRSKIIIIHNNLVISISTFPPFRHPILVSTVTVEISLKRIAIASRLRPRSADHKQVSKNGFKGIGCPKVIEKRSGHQMLKKLL